MDGLGERAIYEWAMERRISVHELYHLRHFIYFTCIMLNFLSFVFLMSINRPTPWKKKSDTGTSWCHGALCHLRAHIGSTGPGELAEDCEMNELTLPSRQIIQNSSPGGLRPSTLPLGHGGFLQYLFITSELGRNILFLWNLRTRAGLEHAYNDRRPIPYIQMKRKVLT